MDCMIQPVRSASSSKSFTPMHRQNTHSAFSTQDTKARFKCEFCSKPHHRIYRCRKFLSQKRVDRLRDVKRLNLCTNCLSSAHQFNACDSPHNCNIPNCNERHHSLLHQFDAGARTKEMPSNMSSAQTSIENPQPSTSSNTLISSCALEPFNTDNFNLNSVSCSRNSYVFLATALITATDINGEKIFCRALLDSGSQINLITEALALQLGIQRHQHHIQLGGVGNTLLNSKFKVYVTIKSRINDFSANIEACVLSKITNFQPNSPVNIKQWPLPNNIKLADPHFYKPQKIDLLIGAVLYYKLLSVGQISLAQDMPLLQNTLLGWIVVGNSASDCDVKSLRCPTQVHHVTNLQNDINLNHQLEKFFQIEDIDDAKQNYSLEEKLVEKHFMKHVHRNKEGKFVVSLPFSKDPSILGDSLQMATHRFHAIERNLSKNPLRKQEYIKFMEDYHKLGHMELISHDMVPQDHYFLPHHCVIKPHSSSTKLRVVFYASAKTSSGVSLNDILMIGPVVQQDLFSILLRFRTHQFVLSADIKQMYRQILVHPSDTNLQCILWRNSPDTDINIYRLRTVTYGTASAPYLATKCLQKLAHDETTTYKLASKVIESDMYVDDLLTGANSLLEIQQIKSQVIDMLSTAGMELRKFCSNVEEVLSDIPKEHRETLLHIENSDYIKTLGMFWNPVQDVFSFKVPETTKDHKITRRTVLSDISRIFDPMGLASPVITMAKLFMQELWSLKQHWDAALPQELFTRWKRYQGELHLLNILKVKRYVMQPNPVKIQLHCFADASQSAYGAVIYIRSVSSDGNVYTSLLCSKSRVAPKSKLKLTIPKLELCAALLAAQLVDRVIPTLKLIIDRIFYWSDSTIVLAWLGITPNKLTTFVSNRVLKVQQLTEVEDWHHVSSSENAADIVSRGALPSSLIKSSIWLSGPPFLLLNEQLWTTITPQKPSPIPECRAIKDVSHVLINEPDLIESMKYRNSFKSVRNIMAYVMRFINNVKPGSLKRTDSLTSSELELGIAAIVKIMQMSRFAEERNLLIRRKPLNQNCHLNSLSVFLDDNNLIRVGGRLHHASLSYSSKHPLLLPSTHPFTLIILKHFHLSHLHAGPQAILAAVRQQFWPVNGKRLAQKVYKNCIRCSRIQPRELSQLMGNLPYERVTSAPPFYNSGLDFCGPFYVHHRIRGKGPTKTYIAVFVCLAIKAVHLELVSDLTTASFIGALKRFIATRGMCKNIFSDNGTNFVGANSELHLLYQLFVKQQHLDEITKLCSEDEIQWHFAPPSGPHFGGIYEAAVKSAKTHLKKVMANAALTYEELSTLIKQIEAVLNSRPITPLSSHPADLQALTPGHFLVNRPLTSIVEPNIEDERISTLKRWRIQQQMHQHFWSRWSNEYLTQMQHRRKWTSGSENIAVNDLVIIKDDNLPPLKWRLGRVINVHPGTDGYVRVATLKTMQGVIKRPIAKLCPLPMDDLEQKLKDRFFQRAENVAASSV